MEEECNRVIMVTGSSGLIGYALQRVVEKDKISHERWIFLSSKDADLTYVDLIKPLATMQTATNSHLTNSYQ